ncbi:Crp/Fnr family transcriptional regulator [Microbaculum marinum]|uniref:Crp/Fnr family transcriptional regulator n=1 Tax=Microbaculum marinum TaxID=1764581 RepID=A0AAW9RPP5_9HYPH
MAARDVSIRIPCSKCPLRDLECFRDFTEKEVEFLHEFKQGELTVNPGAPIVLEESNSPHLYTVLEGWGFRYKTLPDGRRQILNYVMPGDFIGLQSSVFEVMSHGVEALTEMMMCVFPRDKLWTLYTRHPTLAFDVTWLASREERLLDEHLLTVGRRTAIERVAFVIWHLYKRALSVGLASGNRLDLPVTQQHLADTLGLSLVHTNKTLKKLRANGCISVEERTVEVLDKSKLIEIAQAQEHEEGPRPFL